MQRTFDQALEHGSVGEHVIAQWLRHHGYSIMPAYEKTQRDYKGPRVLLPSGELVAPDLLAFITRNGTTSMMWIEAKTKERFTWHRLTRQWQTGIDTRHFNDYHELWTIHKIPVHVLFLHRSPQPSSDDLAHGSPDSCPSGLFGQRIDILLERAQQGPQRGHVHNGRFASMTYWNHSDLIHYASNKQLDRISLKYAA